MPTTEEKPPIDWSPSLRHALALIVLAELLVFVFSWAEGRPWTKDRSLDLVATAVLAAAAGFCLAFARSTLSALRAPMPPDDTLDPAARSLRRQYRAVYWFSVGMMLLGCALLLLFAVSLGTGHGEWVSWFPSRGHSRYRL
jgi:hypothetical protein